MVKWLCEEKKDRCALSKEKKAAKKRSRLGKICAKMYRKIASQRKSFCHKKSIEIVQQCPTIWIRGLEIKTRILLWKKHKQMLVVSQF